ncbi:MAG: hypothetical protein QHG99_07615 [Methanomicrobiales archaeon]|nr:hypothetical protein [Methanomicrobiales archaeon]
MNEGSPIVRADLVSDPLHRSKILEYVKGCRCGSGGYCFYRLDEPNAADTYHALFTMVLLGEDVRDEKTV